VLPTVRITVDAGVQTTVAQADIQVTSPQEGEKAGSWQRQSIGRNWPLEVGQPFSQAAWASAKAEGLRSLQARRYPTAALTTSRAEIDADTHQAHLQAHYATGPLVRFGALTIEGGERYDNAGVARAARLPVGAEYRQTTLLDVQQRMAATGLYDSVFLTLQTDNIPPDATEVQVPVLAQVREAPLRKWVYGAGMALGKRVLASNRAVNVFHRGFVACDSYANGEAAVAAIACPVLFVLGAQDQMTHPKAAQGLIRTARAAGKQVQVVSVPCGHHQMTEAPEETLAALRDFLRTQALA
jgi:outer membrane translocation and assembly module TamA